jgi:hypothetical protein
MQAPRFFSVDHNSFYKRSFPWIQRLGAGFCQVYLCGRCACAPARSIMYADGPVEAFLESEKGVKWPDVIGCGHFPFLILSERALRAFSAEGVGDFPHHAVLIQPPLPKRLVGSDPPRYLWLDGQKMRGALMDFEASGFVDVRFCPECGTRTDNIGATSARQHSRVCPYAFRSGTWDGSNLFTTDLSHCSFFCTEAVVSCAHKHKLTNFRFVHAEQGGNPGSKGVEYL